jgi:hypothetical protein
MRVSRLLLLVGTLVGGGGARPSPGNDEDMDQGRRRLFPRSSSGGYTAEEAAAASKAAAAAARRAKKRAGTVDAMLSRVEPAPERVMPHVGPLRGVGLFDYERVTFFADREQGSGTKHGACSLRSCEGSDLVASIQSDLRPWRERGGMGVKDVNAAADLGQGQGWVRVTVSEGEVYAREFGKGWGVRDGLWLLMLLELKVWDDGNQATDQVTYNLVRLPADTS